jgi:signal transduction histidine kinase
MLRQTSSGKLDERGRQCVEHIVRGTERLDQLVRDVLDYSRTSRGEIKVEAIDLDKLIREIVHEQPALEPLSGEIQIESPLLKVKGHKAPLSQAIANLLSNAVKFVPKGTCPEVRIRTEARGPRVRLWIEDNGIGIAKEHQERAFGIFERVNTNAQYEGTGIGLAIVRKAVERMGGKTGVESDLGKGSRFWIELPGAGEG